MNSYYYLDAANQQQGPLDGNLLPSKGVTAQTLVWANGMAEWTAAGQVAELQPLFAAQPAAAPTQPAQPAYQQPSQPAYQQPQPAYQQPQPAYQQPAYQQPAYQQPAQPAAGAPVKPDNYLVWAILSTICCCLITGIVSIVYSTKVDGLYAAGQYAEAQAAANSAKKWAIAGAICSAVIWLLYVLIYVVILGGAVAASGGW